MVCFSWWLWVLMWIASCHPSAAFLYCLFDLYCMEGRWERDSWNFVYTSKYICFRMKKISCSFLYYFLLMFSHSLLEQGFSSVQDAVLRQLHDEDLTVVRAAVSLDGLTEIVNSSDVLEALNNVIKRCIGILNSSEFVMYFATQIFLYPFHLMFWFLLEQTI